MTGVLGEEFYLGELLLYSVPQLFCVYASHSLHHFIAAEEAKERGCPDLHADHKVLNHKQKMGTLNLFLTSTSQRNWNKSNFSRVASSNVMMHIQQKCLPTLVSLFLSPRISKKTAPSSQCSAAMR